MTHTLTLKAIEPVTHDVNHLVFDRPKGFEFTPGQATDFALDKDGWRDEQRPFTFTGLPDADRLEFVIRQHRGEIRITKMLPDHLPEYIAEVSRM